MDNSWLDVVVFAAIAGFLWLKLRKSLGETKEGAPPPLDVSPLFSAKTDTSNPHSIPPLSDHLSGPLSASQWSAQLPDYNVVSSATAHHQVGTLLQSYPTFNPAMFLDGAKRALPMIVHGYANNDQAVLNKLLAPELAQNFATKNAARTTPYDAHVHEVKKATIASAKLDGTQAFVTVDFVSVETINNQPKKDIADTWTFTKDTTDTSNIWLLHSIHDDIDG